MIILRTFRVLLITPPWGILVVKHFMLPQIISNCGFNFFVAITMGKILGKFFMLRLVMELGLELWEWGIGPASVRELVKLGLWCRMRIFILINRPFVLRHSVSCVILSNQEMVSRAF